MRNENLHIKKAVLLNVILITWSTKMYYIFIFMQNFLFNEVLDKIFSVSSPCKDKKRKIVKEIYAFLIKINGKAIRI